MPAAWRSLASRRSAAQCARTTHPASPPRARGRDRSIELPAGRPSVSDAAATRFCPLAPGYGKSVRGVDVSVTISKEPAGGPGRHRSRCMVTSDVAAGMEGPAHAWSMNAAQAQRCLLLHAVRTRTCQEGPTGLLLRIITTRTCMHAPASPARPASLRASRTHGLERVRGFQP